MISTMTGMLLKKWNTFMLSYYINFKQEEKEEILYFHLIKMMVTSGSKREYIKA